MAAGEEPGNQVAVPLDGVVEIEVTIWAGSQICIARNWGKAGRRSYLPESFA